MKHSTDSLPLQGSWRGQGTFLIQSTCVWWACRGLMTMSLEWCYVGYCGSMGYRGCCNESSNTYITEVKVVFIFLAEVTHISVVMASACLSYLWFSWKGALVAAGERVCLVWGQENHLSAFSRQCGHVGIFKLLPPANTGTVWVWTGWDESQHPKCLQS